MYPGLIIAAPGSAHGKTTVTLGLLRHLTRSGIAVAPFKVGPDYIDPAFHAAAAARPCPNLDPWAMRTETLAAAVALGGDAALHLVEGVMGLFDGAALPGPLATTPEGHLPDGSTAHVAQLSGWPVVLVMDVRAQAGSAAAVVRGFATHRPGVNLVGVIFNRVGSATHAETLRTAMAGSGLDIPVLGCLPREDALEIPHRHLGLVQAEEHPALEAFLDAAADRIAAHVDVGRLRSLARPWIGTAATGPLAPLPPLGQRIALARDAAFAFAYPLVLAGWHSVGAEILPFSPLADEGPAADADAVYLPGGYPELHAGRLAGNTRFLEAMRAAAAQGATIYGECGGYMVLGNGIEDADGQRHGMTGLLGLETSFARRRLSLGYRQVAAIAASPLAQAGAVFRGHEFHYAQTISESGTPLFRIKDAAGRARSDTGLISGTVAGSFIHLIDRA
ncbi:MAG: cobyrinate a,c-diamide synthase [Magnetospiraceae bacterium]